MHGFEAGAGIDCIWSNLLSKHLESKYKVRKKALGWPYQVQVFADKKSMDWVLTFKQLMIEVIEISTLAYSTDRLERLKQGLNKK